MRPVSVTAFSQARALAPSVVDLDPRHEVILLCSATGRGEALALAESLLALGFETFVLCGTTPELAADLERHGQAARPALLVGTDPDTVGPVLRSRVARCLSRPHCWLEGEPGGGALELRHRICARMSAFEREHVVLLPVAPKSVPAAPQVKKLSRLQLVAWPLAGAALAALGLVLWGTPDSEAPIPSTPPPRVPAPAAISPSPPSEVEHRYPAPVAVDPVFTAAVPPAPVPPLTAVVHADPLGDVLDNKHVIATDEWLVYEAPARARDWYAAMDLCRGRSHAGTDGWSTPSSKQLHALAKARVLPEGSLWSRTRALRSENVAFVVHGRAGTARRAIKSETIDSAVCVRRRSPSP